jgi:ribose 5-phosphate isomerase RpiB
MKIAVVTEGSTKTRNADVLKALDGMEHEVFNLGMKNIDGEPDLTYMETALISALALNLKAVDFVVGGCGTGQGYMNAALQYPGVACGLLMDSVEAFLYAKVNAGNCISLQLNKGYGNLGGDVNIRLMLEFLFKEGYGEGYPPARAELQINARKKLVQLSQDTHLPMEKLIGIIDRDMVKKALSFPGVMDCFKNAPDSALKDAVVSLAV